MTRQPWWRSWPALLLPALVGLATAIGGFLAVRALDDARARGEVQGLAEDRQTVLASHLQGSLLRLEALHAFWRSSQEVLADEFTTFAAHLMTRDDGVQALEWAPRVTADERRAFEAGHATRLPGFRITEQGWSGLVTAGERPFHYPITFLEPMAGNADALGFDLASEPVRLATLRRSIERRQPTVSPPLHLVQAAADPTGILCIWPVFAGGPESMVEPDGVLVGAFRLGTIAARALGSTPLFARIAVDLDGRRQVLLGDTNNDMSGTVQASGTLQALGLDWLVEVHAPAALVTARRTPLPWLALAAGVVLLGLLVFAFAQKQLRGEGLALINAQLRREAEMLESLQETQKLESLGVLASGIAHDFNNLLTGIQGNADLAMAELPAGAARDRVAQILLAADRAAGLTAQLLAYAGRAPLRRQPLDLSATIAGIAELMRTALPSGAELRLDLDPDLPPVEGDPVQLQQVVLNLVINGAEAGRGAANTVTVATAAVPAPDGPGGVRLSVTDTGAGMPPDVQRRMFEPFFTTKFTGRGLGLAAVQGIVRAHGGDIAVRSAPGQGTTIDVRLPATAVAAAPEPTAAPPRRGHGAVLLVDDEPLVLDVGRRILSSLGYDVLTAGDGPTALAIFRTSHERLRLVILDVTMPGMDGPELLRAIRRIAVIPALFSSGYHASELKAVMQETGAGFLPKPYTRSTMSECLRQVLGEPVA